ncbi:hypothetical protein [Vitreimonas flagellata]|uniref:hypothetical protein n=1 Tax=Vitreimonas flagellata TaxID=2560861 RepID=UPI00142FABB4|nr:hypothetical protein [Vitreimonas flagellata]
MDANNQRLSWEAERDNYLDEVSAASHARAPLPPRLRAAPVMHDDLERIAGAPP